MNNTEKANGKIRREDMAKAEIEGQIMPKEWVKSQCLQADFSFLSFAR